MGDSELKRNMSGMLLSGGSVVLHGGVVKEWMMESPKPPNS
jgi:hypothetical protein